MEQATRHACIEPHALSHMVPSTHASTRGPTDGRYGNEGYKRFTGLACPPESCSHSRQAPLGCRRNKAEAAHRASLQAVSIAHELPSAMQQRCSEVEARRRRSVHAHKYATVERTTARGQRVAGGPSYSIPQHTPPWGVTETLWVSSRRGKPVSVRSRHTAAPQERRTKRPRGGRTRAQWGHKLSRRPGKARGNMATWPIVRLCRILA